jgi:hypothetical protein
MVRAGPRHTHYLNCNIASLTQRPLKSPFIVIWIIRNTNLTEMKVFVLN